MLLEAIIIAATTMLVPGTSNTWTDGVNTWAGNPSCVDTGMLLQANSPAIDAGEIIPGVHCPVAGPSPDGSCQEWYGAAPDIGACEFVPANTFGGMPAAPGQPEVQ